MRVTTRSPLKKRLSIVVVAVAALLLFVAASPVLGGNHGGRGSGGDVIPGHFIVVLQPGASPGEVAVDHGLARVHTYRRALNGFAAPIPPGRVDNVKADIRVKAVGADRTIVPFGEPQVVPTWIKRIQADQSTVLPASINAVRISFIDSGIPDHPDINRVAGSKNAKGPPGRCDHAVGVAGMAAAIDNGIDIVGVAPGAQARDDQVFDAGCSGSFAAILAAIDSILADASTAVVNMSLGATCAVCTDDSDDPTISSFHEAVIKLVNAGKVVVVAAGNNAADAKNTVPAAFDEVITVSAMFDSDGVGGGGETSGPFGTPEDSFVNAFSNFGADIDLSAVGEDVLTLTGNSGVHKVSGTSFSSPTVAGAVALFIAANGPATDAAGVAAIRQALIDRGFPQHSADGFTGDPDPFHEPLVNAGDPVSQTEGTIAGKVTKSDGGAAISGATVSVDTGQSTTTADIGTYSITDVSTGERQVTASADGFESQTKTATVTDGLTTDVNFALAAVTTATKVSVTVTTDEDSYVNRENVQITVTVTDGTNPVEDADVQVVVTTANGNKLAGDGTTNNDGVAKFRFKVNSKRHGVGTYTVDATASKDGFESGSGSTTFKVTK